MAGTNYGVAKLSDVGPVWQLLPEELSLTIASQIEVAQIGGQQQHQYSQQQHRRSCRLWDEEQRAPT